MKTLGKQVFALLLLVGMAVSCDSWLDVEYKSGIGAANMWQEEADFVAAVNGAYRQFRSAFQTNYAFWGEYRTGIWGEGNDGSESYRDEIYANKIPSSNSFCNWAGLYTTINDCNLILKHVPDITFSSEELQQEIQAHAYFIRAFCYYWISRLWGDAPLLTVGFESDKQEGVYPYRDPVSNLYNQVDDDIEAALRLMPATAKYYNKASLGSINMLKVDFHLWMAKVVNREGEAIHQSLLAARQAITQLDKMTQYELLPYADVFDVTNKGNKEIVFAWSLLRDEAEGGYMDVFLEAVGNVSSDLYENPVKVGSVRQRCFLTPEHMDFLASDSRDTRRVVTFDTCYDIDRDRTQQWVNKLCGTWESGDDGNGTRIFDSDIPVYRYADYFLFKAEVENALDNKNEAIDALNRIAERAYGVADYYPKTLTKEEVDERILDERLKEFTAEGKLWWDMVRFGKAFERIPSLVGREGERNILLWPIADGSINGNPNVTPNEFDY